MGDPPKPLERLEWFFDLTEKGRVVERLQAESAAQDLFIKGNGEATAVDPSDVVQGQHKDCFLIAGLAAVVQAHPQRDRFLKDMIKPRADGTYDVTIYEFSVGNPLEGEVPGYRPVTVNVSLETLEGPATSDDPGELWPALVEKAYAQASPAESQDDSYGFDGGSPGIAMTRLTGLPSQSLNPMQTTIGTLADYQAKGYAITVTTYAKSVAGSPLEPVNMLPEYQPGGLVASNSDRSPERVNTHDDSLRPWHVYYVKSVDPAAGTVTIHNVWDERRQDIQIPYEQFQTAIKDVDVNPVLSRERPH